MKRHETIVIGAGSGGLTVAIGLARLGRDVALVEGGEMGGECTNSGCVPSKALIHAAKVGMKGKEAMLYVRQVIKDVRAEESVKKMEELGIVVYQGWGRFRGERELEVLKPNGGVWEKGSVVARLAAEQFVVATGSKPQVIEIPGLPEEKLLTNENVFELENVPRSLMVVGVGPIGCELACAFAKLGTKVEMVYRGKGILKNEDNEVGSVVLKKMESLGVVFHWDTDELRWGKGRLVGVRKGKEIDLGKPEYVMQALGRVPTTECLDLAKSGVEYDGKGIEVDGRYRTNQRHVFAIGDVIKGPKFTHVANAQGRVVVSSILFPRLPGGKLGALPAVTFTDPEVGTVGMSLDEVEKIDERLVSVITVQLEDQDRAKTDDVHEGLVKVWAHRLTGKVYRASVVGENAGEMLGFWSVVMDGGVSLWKVWRMMVAYPTMSLANRKVGDVFAGETLGNLKQVVRDVLMAYLVKYQRQIVALGFWLVLLLGLFGYMRWNGLGWSGLLMEVEGLLVGSAVGMIIYVVLGILRPVILFPATLITIMAGALYGLGVGYVLALAAGTLSALLPYGAGRWFRGEGQGGLGSWEKSLRKNPFMTVVLMRLLFLPYDLVSVVAGALRIDAVAFMMATLIGNLVGTFAFVSFGASFEGSLSDLLSGEVSIDPWNIVLGVGVMAVALGINWGLKKWKRS